MNAFDLAFEKIIGIEGGYSNHPNDRGGQTKYGITEAVARENGYTGEMKVLPLPTAKEIYKTQYWDKMNLQAISLLWKTSSSQTLVEELFEIGVNLGVHSAAVFLQRAINCFWQSPIAIDGIIGSKTLTVLQMTAYSAVYQPILLKMLNAQQCVKYMEIVESNSTQKGFLVGWISNRVS